MAMTKCPECSKEVSSEAKTCPHCGYPLKPDTYSKKNTGYSLYEVEYAKKTKEMIIGGIIALVAAVIFLFFLGNPVVQYDAEALGMVIGASLGFAIVGIIYLVKGINRSKY